MIRLTCLYIFICSIFAVYKGVTAQKYYGMCDTNNCGNLTCVQQYPNENAHYCIPSCSGNITNERNCVSNLTCSQRNCTNGTSCNLYLGYTACECPVGFAGDQCQNDTKIPCPQRCIHNWTSTCTQEPSNDVICHCDFERAGVNCSVYLCKNDVIACGNEGTCVSLPDDHNLGFRCDCNPGRTGQLCENDIDECASNPCHNNATCLNLKNAFICNCTGNWTDTLCNVPIGEENRAVCFRNNCTAAKSSNGKCDKECDHMACDFDNTECSFGVENPWDQCSAGAKHCMEKFDNGTCDAECNNESCLYDGFDCLPPVNCENEHCYRTINDGVCDSACNTSACFFDGNDCSDKMAANSSSLGTLMLKFSNYPNQTETVAKSMFNFLAQKIGVSTRAALHIRRRSENMLYFKGNNMWTVYYDIKNIYSCGNDSSSCWTNLESYRRALAAYLRSNTIMKLPGNITSISIATCEEGQYGEMCERNCSMGCQANSCSSETGNCDCISGYYGRQCNSLEACRNCKNDNCVNSTCVEGCKLGYKGTFCNQTCSNGTYGDMCSMNCSSKCAHSCDNVNGTCIHGCKSGYSGIMCDMRCPRGKYGMNCNMKCSGNCVHNDGCNHETGHCDRGCKSGWKNVKCDTECPAGKYGQGCLHNCGQCASTCSKINGECYKCNKGWAGKLCTIPATAPQHQGNMRTTNVIVPVVVVVIIIVLIILLIAIFCVWKRTQKDGYSVDEKDTEMNPIFKERSPSTADNNAPDTAALLTTSANPEVDLDEEKLTMNNDDGGIVNPTMNIEDEKGGVYTGDDDSKNKPVTGGEESNVQNGLQTSGEETEKPDDQDDKGENIKEDQNEPGDTGGGANEAVEGDTYKKEEDKEDVKKEDGSEKSDKDRKSSSSSGSSSSSKSSNEDNEKLESKPPDTVKDDRPLSEIHGTTTGGDGVLHTPI